MSSTTTGRGIGPADDAYLREIERLARRVVAVSWGAEGAEGAATPLARAVAALGRALRHEHFEGDGCGETLDGDGGTGVFVRLAAVALLTPSNVHPELGVSYEDACDQLGVSATPQGWALWHTWSVTPPRLPVTMVVRSVASTVGLVRNWAEGREVLPVRPVPSAIALVRMGWWRMQAAVLSPAGVRRLGLVDGGADD